VVVKYGHADDLRRIEVIEAGHPIPDANGVGAARRIADLARRADDRTLVLTLLSGGASALLCAPLDDPRLPTPLTLDDKQAVTRALLACGADIGEINCVRKHLSAVKGGRLAQAIAPAPSLTLILSDVIGDRLDTIASGPTVPDESSFADALAVIDKYRLRDDLPRTVVRALELGRRGMLPETLKATDPVAGLAASTIIGNNRAAVQAAGDHARALGFTCTTLAGGLTGEARAAARTLFAIARDARERAVPGDRPTLIVAGGETVVTVTGTGKGGRNQEMALAFLAEMAGDDRRGRGIFFLSAATDGTDGPTDAAGAFAATAVLDRARQAGLSIDGALRDNNAYEFFDRIGFLLRTGPTRTNVCDLHLIIVSGPAEHS